MLLIFFEAILVHQGKWLSLEVKLLCCLQFWGLYLAWIGLVLQVWF
jgi:hypothetical protein